MNKLYINLIPILIGGGLQNAINFLKNIELRNNSYSKKQSKKEILNLL